MTSTEGTARHRRTLERYWAIYAIEDALVDAAVADVFTPDADFACAALGSPLRGHRDISNHLRHIRAAFADSATRHITDVQWVHETARWCWRSSGPDHSSRGMDIARLTADGERIESIVVFAGLLPAPA